MNRSRQATNSMIDRLNTARGQKARENLVNALRECGELADAVAHFEGDELLEVLNYLDSLRFVMAESGQILQGVVRGQS
jgi:NTP pyrophosphatase (non-canonical NTP hydrolase)